VLVKEAGGIDVWTVLRLILLAQVRCQRARTLAAPCARSASA
jgi:hypothetical protein